MVCNRNDLIKTLRKVLLDMVNGKGQCLYDNLSMKNISEMLTFLKINFIIQEYKKDGGIECPFSHFAISHNIFLL